MGGGLHRAIVESANLRIGDSLICCTGATPLSAPGTAPTRVCGPFPIISRRSPSLSAAAIIPCRACLLPRLAGSARVLSTSFFSGRLFLSRLFLALFCPQFLREVASMQTAYRERRAAHTCESIIDGSLTLDLHPSVAKETRMRFRIMFVAWRKGKNKTARVLGSKWVCQGTKQRPGNA